MTQDIKISIITPSYQQAAYLEQTIQSVLDQGYANLEYIVIDGGSTDGSLEILQRFSDSLTYWVSEPDNGQTHAINKGLTRATGDVLAYLNSDDLLLPGSLQYVADSFSSHSEVKWLCGSVIEFGPRKYPTHLLQSRKPSSIAAHLITPYHFWQQGIFWRREVADDIGTFDVELHFVMDHEYWTRMLFSGYQPTIVEQPLAAMRMHPVSKSCSLARRFDKEIRSVRLNYAARLDNDESRTMFRLRRRSIARRMQETAIIKSKQGNAKSAWRKGMQALKLYPGGILERAFWGCLRRLLIGNRRIG